ncbi:metal-dependent hydrolase [Trinickia acidisoli]|uniref:metal-dependent hydrolase n=1 Tax=Trinickia acidisoli TaxID=2767482 RepID=UPI001A8ECAF9|nr:metal-dependent hydrolase [Trinickia acidisoli]
MEVNSMESLDADASLLRIEARNVAFDLSYCDPTHWHDAGLAVSQFFNAMSLFFPKGEKFFIHSVREHRSSVADASLRRDLQGFMQQEAVHSREHRLHIDMLNESGFATDHMDIRMFAQSLNKVSPKRRLAMTIAMEHFTASLAHEILFKDGVMRGDEQMSALWQWHAAEEIEHKAVAFDVFRAAYGDGLASYLSRCRAALEVTFNFMKRLFANFNDLLSQRSTRSTASHWFDLFVFLWISPGLFRRLAPSFLAYFNLSFHPSKRKDFWLVEQWKARNMNTGRRERHNHPQGDRH